MKSKSKFFFLLFVCIIISIIGIGKAEGACVNPSTTDFLNTNTDYCSGTFNLNCTTSGCIVINSSNINVTGNNTIIIGNMSGYLFSLSNKANVSISGLNMSGYNRIMDLSNSGSFNNVSIHDNIFGNATSRSMTATGNYFYIYNNIFNLVQGVGILPSNSNNSEVYNNTFDYSVGADKRVFSATLDFQYWNIHDNRFINGAYIVMANRKNINITNNLFNTSTNTTSAIQYTNTSNMVILNNSIYNSRIYLENNTALLIQDNKLYGVYNLPSLIYDSQDNGSRIINNTLSLCDRGIVLKSNSSNILISGNNIYNATTNFDAYNYGIGIEYGNNNITIIGNNIVDFAGLGILVRQSTNVNVSNNYFNEVSISNKILRSIKDYYEPTSAIAILEIYRGWLGDNSENSSDNLTNKIGAYNSSNIVVSGNTFGNDVQTYLRNQGGVNVSVSLPSYWYRKVDMIPFLTHPDEFYNNPSFNNLTLVSRGVSENSVFMKTYMVAGTTSEPTPNGALMNYSISQSLMSFKNLNNGSNWTESLTTKINLTVYNGSLLNNTNDAKLNGQFIAADFSTLSQSLNPSDLLEVFDGGCNKIPIENLNVNESMTLCSGTYNMNDSDGNGVLLINASNIVLSCNGTILTPNSYVSSSRGINVNGNPKNVTIQGCNISNYNYNYRGSMYNSTIKNNYFAYHYGIYSIGATNFNMTFFNNTFWNATIYTNGVINYSIINNTFICPVVNSASAGCGDRREAIFDWNDIYPIISGNNVYGAQLGIYLYSTSGAGISATVINNNITYADRAIEIDSFHDSTNNTWIANNTLNNNTNNMDAYQLDIEVLNSSGIHFDRNNATLSVGFVSGQADYDLWFTNNSINMVCSNPLRATMQGVNGAGYSSNEPCTAYQFTELYKSWCLSTPTGTCVVTNGTYLNVSGASSRNITILDTSFSNDTNVYLYSQGLTGLIQNFPTYWYRAFSTGIVDKSELYINNNWDNVSTSANSPQSLGEWMRTNASTYQNFNISKTVQLFYALSNVLPFNVSIFGASAYYPFNDLFNVSSGTIIASNIDNYSLTLIPNQIVRVGNFINLGSCFNVSGSVTFNGGNASTFCFNVLDSTNVTFVNFNLSYPNNDLANLNNNSALQYNIDNYSIVLPVGTYGVSNFNYLSSGTCIITYSTVPTTRQGVSGVTGVINAILVIPNIWLSIIIIVAMAGIVITLLVQSFGKQYRRN